MHGAEAKWSPAAYTPKGGKADEPYEVEVSIRRSVLVRTLATRRSYILLVLLGLLVRPGCLGRC